MIGPLAIALHAESKLPQQLLELVTGIAIGVTGGNGGTFAFPQFLREIPLASYVFALLALLVARTAALGLALLAPISAGAKKSLQCGSAPKGFASVVYGIMVLDSGVEGPNAAFNLLALVIAASVVARNCAVYLSARFFSEHQGATQTETWTDILRRILGTLQHTADNDRPYVGCIPRRTLHISPRKDGKLEAQIRNPAPSPARPLCI